MKGMEILRNLVIAIGIFASAGLGYWTMSKDNLDGVGVSEDWYGLIQNGLIVSVATTGTIGGVLQVTVPKVEVNKKEPDIAVVE